MGRPRIALAVATLSWAIASCRHQAPDLREWQPSDHDHTSESNMAAPAPASDAGSEPASPHGLDEIAVMTWKNQCVRCHGELGNGDGIQPGVHPPDLGDPQVQASLSDLQIAEIIRGGRGVMPAFALPDNTIVALVGLVRLLNRAPREGSDDSDKLVAVPVDAGPARAGTGAPPPSGTTKQRSR